MLRVDAKLQLPLVFSRIPKVLNSSEDAHRKT
jgi:hypothetical protein